MQTAPARLPVLALVGRPNVGKSTLFNRLTGTRDALVADLPGLTRDRQYGSARFQRLSFIVVDTGGLGPEAGDALANLAADQARTAIDEADHILFLVDHQAGVVPVDTEIAKLLRTMGKPVTLVVNKAEGQDRAIASAEFHSLGLGDPQVISAEHNQGVHPLLVRIFPDADSNEAVEAPPEDDGRVRVAVIGRPNVGKSTLTNRLLGEERLLAADIPGTTRDAIRVEFSYLGRQFELVDTAGIRRKARVEDRIEKFSVIKSLQAIERAQVVIVMVDSQDEIGTQDARILSMAAERGRGIVLAVNKWDGLEETRRNEIRREVDRRLPFLDFVPIEYISALHGSGLRDLMRSVLRVWKAGQAELPTPKLSRVLEQAVHRHAPPAVVGRRIKLRYAHQGGRNPPRIVIHGNQTQRLDASYRRYLINQFRAAFDLVGVPIALEFRSGENPFDRRKGR